jgi:hypothetical protein
MSTTPPPGQPDYGRHDPSGSQYGDQAATNPYGYGPAPTGGAPGTAPASVKTAINLIWANVALSVVSFLITLFLLDSIVDQALSDANLAAGTDADVIRSGAIVGAVIGLVIGVGITVLLVIFLRKGANWARIVYTVIAALGIVTGLIGIAGQPALLLVVSLVGLLLTIGAVVMLWKKESTAFFTGR